MNKKVILVIIFLIIVSVFIVYFSPNLTIYSLKRAAEAKDSDKLSQYVDFPTLRESFKANVSAYMASQITKSNNGFEAFGMAIGAAMVNQMADAMITPEYLAMVIKGQNAPIGEINTQQESKSPSKADVDISMSYKGFNQFFVIIKAKDNSTEPVTLIFKRYGIISWKLVGLRLPFASNSLLGASQNQNLISQKSATPNAINNNTALLIPSLTNKVFQAADYQNGILQDAIYFDITFDTSHLKKSTRAVKGDLVLSDLFGEEKFRLNLTINDPLTPGTSYIDKGVWFNYNQFEDSHNWVRNTELKDMTFRFEVTNILYQDETPTSNESVHYPSATGFVVDEAGIIDPDAKSRIEGLIQELKQKTTAEVAVVTVGSTAPLSIEEYAINLFNRLGIGQKGNDNGVLLLVAYNDRRMRIEVGKSLEGVITDDYSSQIINTIMTPEFKDRHFSDGIEKATSAIINIIDGKGLRS